MFELEGSHIDELAALLAVAKAGSFVAAAQALQRHPTILSKRISSLESRLGVRLLERTTRRVRLTDAGARLADKIDSASSILAEAQQEAAAGGVELRGKLRLALPAALGRMWLSPLLPEFARRYPGLEIDVDYSERYVDLVGEGFDAAIRVGILADSRLVARRLSDHRVVLGASADYLARAGIPSTPEDLIGMNLLEYTGPVSVMDWRLSLGDRSGSVTPRGTFRSNDIVSLLDAARKGLGVVCAGHWSMARDFAAGTLLPVLGEWHASQDGGIYLIRPSNRFTPARTQAFMEWVEALFSGGAPWDRVLAKAREAITVGRSFPGSPV